jgi:predicted XRE-type DNA-binding protein
MKRKNQFPELKTESFTMPDGTTETITHGSGNVFADLGLPNADELQWKSSLVTHIRRLIREKGLTQTQVAEIVGMDQPKVSKLLNGKFDEYSVSRMLRILNRLGHSVEVRVAEKEVPPERAHTIIRAVAKVA